VPPAKIEGVEVQLTSPDWQLLRKVAIM